jgi:hypothetical protein
MTSPKEDLDKQLTRDRKVISLILGSFAASFAFPALVWALTPDLLGYVGAPAAAFFAGYGIGSMRTWATLFPLEDELDDTEEP